MASQYAGWAVRLGGYNAIGSGPARALYANEEIFQRLDYRDRSEAAVSDVGRRTLPGEEVAAFVAEKCGVRPEQLFLLIAPQPRWQDRSRSPPGLQRPVCTN